jgi:hypothetical protein
MSDQDPTALPRLDPDEFVGDPPAGESDAAGFVSDDQSLDRTDQPGDQAGDQPTDQESEEDS